MSFDGIYENMKRTTLEMPDEKRCNTSLVNFTLLCQHHEEGKMKNRETEGKSVHSELYTM